MTVLQTGSSIRFLNNDPEPHNVYSPEGRYNLGTWPTGDTKDYTFKKPGLYRVVCLEYCGVDHTAMQSNLRVVA